MSRTVRRLWLFASYPVMATLAPSELTVSELMFCLGTGISWRTRAVATSQMRSRSSWWHPVISQVPSGPKARPHTKEGWGKVAHGSPVAAPGRPAEVWILCIPAPDVITSSA
jgi:hypothetical protein